MTDEKLKVLIADDQPLFAESLATSLAHYADDMAVCGIAHDGEEAVSLAAARRPGVILMDTKMPNVDGIEAAKRILRDFPGVKIIMLSTYHEDELVNAALRAGARGYLLKDISPTELITAIRAAQSGIMQISPGIIRQFIEARYNPPPPSPAAERENRPLDESRFEWLNTLTAREREIFTLIVIGYDNEQIAKKLSLSAQTVRNQVSIIYSKLGVKNRFEIIRLANRTDG